MPVIKTTSGIKLIIYSASSDIISSTAMLSAIPSMSPENISVEIICPPKPKSTRISVFSFLLFPP
jgi:hypothetical protein